MKNAINWEKGAEEGQFHSGDLSKEIFDRVTKKYELHTLSSYVTTNKEKDIRFEEFDDGNGGRITVYNKERKLEADQFSSEINLPEAFLKEMRDDIRQHMEYNPVLKVTNDEIIKTLTDVLYWEDCAWVTVGDYVLYFMNNVIFITIEGKFFMSEKDNLEMRSEIRGECSDCKEDPCSKHEGHYSHEELEIQMREPVLSHAIDDCA